MSSKDGQHIDRGRDQTDTAASPNRIRRLRVIELLGDAKEAILEHEGQDYRLRITANRKLILTK